MAKLVECVPNFSEGQRREVIDAIVGTARETPGVTVLDYSSDPSHNRTVLTFGRQIGRASCRKECRSRWSPYH